MRPSDQLVVLVHGIFDTSDIFGPMRRQLRRKGFNVVGIDLKPNDGRSGIEPLAQQLSDFVIASNDTDLRVTLVGFSLGGMVARVYLQQLGGLAYVDKLVTISSPHNGSLLAHLYPLQLGRELRPGAKFLRQLNADAASLSPLNPLSIRTPYDLMILPSSSSILDGAINCEVPVWRHAGMVNDDRVIAMVVSAIDT